MLLRMLSESGPEQINKDFCNICNHTNDKTIHASPGTGMDGFIIGMIADITEIFVDLLRPAFGQHPQQHGVILSQLVYEKPKRMNSSLDNVANTKQSVRHSQPPN